MINQFLRGRNEQCHPVPAREKSRPMTSGARGAAQILFFTGVRYQRWGEDTHAPQPQGQSSRRKRERVQIGETEGGGRANANVRDTKVGAFLIRARP